MKLSNRSQLRVLVFSLCVFAATTVQAQVPDLKVPSLHDFQTQQNITPANSTNPEMSRLVRELPPPPKVDTTALQQLLKTINSAAVGSDTAGGTIKPARAPSAQTPMPVIDQSTTTLPHVTPAVPSPSFPAKPFSTQQDLTPPAEPVSPSDKPIKLEQINRQLDAEMAQAKADKQGWEEVSNEWTRNVMGRIVLDSVMFDDTDLPGRQNDYFEFRHLRLGVNGTGYGVLDYMLEMEFESDASAFTTLSNVSVQDAFIGVNEVPIFDRVQVGHFKVPFSLSQLHHRRAMTFMERDPMSDEGGFAPGREVGISSFSHSDDLSSTWSTGIFYDNVNNIEKERRDDNQGVTYSSRMTWNPYYDEPSNGRYVVHLGMGYIHTSAQNGEVRFSARPSVNESRLFADTGTISANDFSVYNVEIAANAGQIQFQSEIFYSDIDQFAGGKLNPWSMYAQVAYRLTGEHNRYNRKLGIFEGIKPNENFWMVPGSTGMGAWEVAMRYGYLDFDDTTLASGSFQTLSLGLNWYWTENVVCRMNYIHTDTNEGLFGDTQSDAFALRLGVYF